MFNLFRGIVLVLGPSIGYFIGGRSMHGLLIGLGLAALIVGVELVFDRIRLDVIIFGMIGALGGVLISLLINRIVVRVDDPSIHKLFEDYGILVYGLLAYLGFMVAVKKKEDLDLLDKNIVIKGKDNKEVKVLDTSVLIDGRIADIAETGFLSGKLVVPRFVLHELQQVADSSDSTKRQRGRRGLDILKKLQDNSALNVKIYDKDFPNIKEVDTKLIELAKELGGKVATTDFNLNKVAALQGVSVLNVNDLANSLKSVVLPGDALNIYLAKEGKEKAQGVGYLDDGTMVVVDDGRRHIGKRIPVHVNSILQTSAGRMIFARIQDSHVPEQPAEKQPAPSDDLHSPPAA